jgi:Fe-S-cluster containining protein
MAKKKSKPRARLPLEKQIDALDALYAELPKVDCKGACWDSCSAIQMTPLEHRRTEAAGVAIPDQNADTDGLGVCPALTPLHQCGVYQVRPLVCRLWGAMQTASCPFGCRPVDGELLTDEQAHEFMARVCDISGQHAEAEQIRRPWREHPDRARELAAQYHAALQEAALQESMRRRALIASGRPVLYVRGRGQLSSTPPASGGNA